MSGAPVSLEMLQGLVQRVLDGQKTIEDRLTLMERRLGGRIIQLERRLTKQGTEVVEDLQGQIDDLAERIGRLESKP